MLDPVHISYFPRAKKYLCRSANNEDLHYAMLFFYLTKLLLIVNLSLSEVFCASELKRFKISLRSFLADKERNNAVSEWKVFEFIVLIVTDRV